ncbi:DNA replication factor Cdt1 [Culex quinquefasciatus]|uniref:DNA replication factor Cdt1 n=1 Tax=Culex quinquefasciatus TaxID=7176 RepID=B0X0C6_CULQU|nr:DNA replication factor Cdt1 [Culex quinquefasciatus]|eukprot:XP_001863098.1 DNA replication factor Cdt1 [Culex quinquefasciatus]
MLFNESSRIRWTLSYGDESIEQVDYFKYLGVWLDSDLKWEYQIGKLNSKLSQVAGIFKKISPVVLLTVSQPLGLRDCSLGSSWQLNEAPLASPAKAKSAITAKASQPLASTKPEFGAANSAGNVDRRMRTPTKVAQVSALIKAKLSRNARLTKLKTSLNKIQSGFDKLDRMEKIRLEET